MSVGLELIGISLGILGWIIAIVACALPMWRVTAFIGSNIVTAQIIWEGLWMTCVVQSTGQMQCKVYDSMLALSQDLQAARALTVISILLAILAVLVAIAGAKCTNCIDDEASKAKVMIISGVFFIVSGVMQLIPVSWSANTIIRDFYNPLLTDAQRRELGAALYIGWAAAALLILGGGAALLLLSATGDQIQPITDGVLGPAAVSRRRRVREERLRMNGSRSRGEKDFSVDAKFLTKSQLDDGSEGKSLKEKKGKFAP